MACNDPKFKAWRPATDAEIAKLEAEVQDKLDSIQEIIINEENSREKDSGFIHSCFIPANYVLENLVHLGMAFSEYDAKDHFYANSKCIGCGVCEKVCLSGKVKMIDKKSVWQENVKCYMCYACLNYCPVQALKIPVLEELRVLRAPLVVTCINVSKRKGEEFSSSTYR